MFVMEDVIGLRMGRERICESFLTKIWNSVFSGEY